MVLGPEPARPARQRHRRPHHAVRCGCWATSSGARSRRRLAHLRPPRPGRRTAGATTPSGSVGDGTITNRNRPTRRHRRPPAGSGLQRRGAAPAASPRPARSGAGARTPTASSATAPAPTAPARPGRPRGSFTSVGTAVTGSRAPRAPTAQVLCWGDNRYGQLGPGLPAAARDPGRRGPWPPRADHRRLAAPVRRGRRGAGAPTTSASSATARSRRSTPCLEPRDRAPCAAVELPSATCRRQVRSGQSRRPRSRRARPATGARASARGARCTPFRS